MLSYIMEERGKNSIFQMLTATCSGVPVTTLHDVFFKRAKGTETQTAGSSKVFNPAAATEEERKEAYNSIIKSVLGQEAFDKYCKTDEGK